MNILFITNILTPYRMTFYSTLNRTVLQSTDNSKMYVCAMTNELPLRPWKYEDLKEDYTYLLTGRKVFLKGQDYILNFHLRKVIDSINPDIVIIAGSWTYPTVILLTLFKRFYFNSTTKLFFWYESHDNASDEFVAKSLNKNIAKALKRNVLNQFDGFCVPGELARHSVSKYVSNKPFVYLRNAVDGEYYIKANEMKIDKRRIRKKYGIDESSIAIIIPARLIKLKGINEMISRISPQIIDNFFFEFVLAGEGDQKEIILETAKEKGVKTVFLGYQQQENIRELLAACDFFCLSSLTDANPLSAIEAAWAGLPLLMSKYTGNYPELIVEGVNGFVFDPLNEESINMMFSEVFSKDASWLKTASDTSLAIAKGTFDVDKITEYFWRQLSCL